MMICCKFLRNDPRVRQFIVEAVGALEPYRVRFDGLIRHPSHSRYNGAGIDSAAQESSQRDIANEADTDTLEKLLAQLFDPLVFRVNYHWRPGGRVPVLLGSDTTSLDNQVMSGQQLLYSFEQRVGGRHISESEILAKSRKT